MTKPHSLSFLLSRLEIVHLASTALQELDSLSPSPAPLDSSGIIPVQRMKTGANRVQLGTIVTLLP